MVRENTFSTASPEYTMGIGDTTSAAEVIISGYNPNPVEDIPKVHEWVRDLDHTTNSS